MDHYYQPYHLPNTWEARLAQKLVTQLLSRSGKLRRHATLKDFEKVIQLWRRRISQFRRNGWAKAHGKQSQYLRNCAPYGVATRRIPGNTSMWFFCRQTRICPWCWMRSLIPRVLQCVRSVTSPAFVRYQVYHRELSYLPGELPDPPKVPISEHTLGEILLYALSPSESHWDLYIRRLWVLQKPSLAEDLPASPSVWNRILPSLCAYPKNLLFGPPERAILTLQYPYRTLRLRGQFALLAPHPVSDLARDLDEDVQML